MHSDLNVVITHQIFLNRLLAALVSLSSQLCEFAVEISSRVVKIDRECRRRSQPAKLAQIWCSSPPLVPTPLPLFSRGFSGAAVYTSAPNLAASLGVGEGQL